MIRWMDGALLVDVWDELDLPDPVRSEWKWAIRLAREPLRPDTLRFFLTEDPELTSTAWVRGYEPLPPTSATAPAETFALRSAPAAVSAGRAVDGRVRTDSVTVL